jgi:RNA polymerase sigma-70 factor, ECF subfamily
VGSWTEPKVLCSRSQVETCVRAASRGSILALGKLVDASRNYLLEVAKQSPLASLQATLSPLDLVRQTALEAHRDFAGFQASSSKRTSAWMRRILLNNVANAGRHFNDTANKDTATKDTATKDTAKRNVLPGIIWKHVTCVRQIRSRISEIAFSVDFARATQCCRTAKAQLPTTRQSAIELRYREHLSLRECAQSGCSPAAVQKLWARAIERLQSMRLNDYDQS